ncbi:hypothetical protein V9L05_08675 [Bernardetia sp. Wsw4-3y2]|uniref:hypothetical protein n=1 Tax=Bernardetia sp. Wsw4-3y2 TaxID=3127471 RepID=UPI0030CDF11D
MQFTPVKRKNGLGAISQYTGIKRVLEVAIQQGFLPNSFSALLSNFVYHGQPFLDAYRKAEGFIYPSKIGDLPNVNCDCFACKDLCNTIKDYNNLRGKIAVLGQEEGAIQNVHNAFIAAFLWLAANELQGTELAQAEKLLSPLMQNVPVELQSKILGIPDTNIKYMQTEYLEKPPAPTVFMDEMPQKPVGDVTDFRGSEPYHRTSTDNGMMYTTGAQSPLPQNSSASTQNYYVVGEAKTPNPEGNNYWWYVGAGGLVIGGIITTVVLLKPKKKKSKKRR